MSYHSSCPNCRNTSEGYYLYRCNHCGQVYCDECQPRGYQAICHACHQQYSGSLIGSIKK